MRYKKRSNTPKLHLLRPSWKSVGIGIVILIILAGSGYALHAKLTNSKTDKPVFTEDGESVNLNPATDEEKQEAENRKDDIVKEQNQPKPPANEKAKITPTIVDANQYDQAIEVRANAPVVEGDGQCQITFKQGSNTVTKQVAAIPDASSTRCTNLSVPRSEFASAGTWEVTVSYNSSKSEGSTTTKVTIR